MVLLFLGLNSLPLAAQELRIGPSWEMSLDIPHIWAILRRTPTGTPLQGDYGIIDAYFDTGASGILLARESRDLLGVLPDPTAVFYDIGVGGAQEFQVSEPLYVSLAGYTSLLDYPPISAFAQQFGPYRLQLTLADDPLMGALDVFGIPLMMGKTIVLLPSDLNNLFDIVFFRASVHNSDEIGLPVPDFAVKLRFKDYVFTTDPDIVPPLPTAGYNPVIDDIKITRDGVSSTGTYLLDTGASISMISPAQAAKLGLTTPDGTPIVTPDDTIEIGGIGGSVTVPIYVLDQLEVPTLNGYKLVFESPALAVHQIGTFDDQTGQELILDGIFGSNFLDVYLMDDSRPFSAIILDTVRGILGFKVNSWVTLPAGAIPANPWPATDFSRDCRTNARDLAILTDEWLNSDCGTVNFHCAGADLDHNGTVNLADFSTFAQSWLTAVTAPGCP